MLRGSVVFCYSVYGLNIFIMGFATYMTRYVMWVKWAFTVVAGWFVPIEWRRPTLSGSAEYKRLPRARTHIAF